ncbi:hypothetical protein M758_5G055900 [Ceratodon purpureus]|nr:hypothetical protein M758_5G055900 [Ceratodon purpureus]
MAMAAQALCYLDAKVQRNAEIVPRHPVSARSHQRTGMRLRRFSVNLERSDGLVISRSGFLGVGLVRGSGDVVQRRKRRTPAASLREETNSGLVKEELPSEQYKQWDALTARIADSATVAFLLLQLPQIVLNTQNLVSGNHVALTAIPWMGQLTGLLGNLSLLSYFAGKKERGATVVQAVGVVSTGVVLSQLALGGAMPVPVFLGTACVVVLGLLLNWLSYFNKLSPGLWHLWGDAVTVGGLTVLPQVMWSTFVPYVPPSILPGSIFGAFALILVMLVSSFVPIFHDVGGILVTNCIYDLMDLDVGLAFIYSDDCMAGSAQQVATSSIEVLRRALRMDSNSSLYVGSCGTSGMFSTYDLSIT